MSMKGFFKEIPGYEGLYECSKDGRIRSIRSGKELVGYRRRCEAPYVLLSKNGKSKSISIHRLIALTFLGPVPDGMIVYHLNGAKLDNHLSNIGFTTQSNLCRSRLSGANRKPVVKIDLNGNDVEVYASASEAARKNHWSKAYIISNCNDKHPISGEDFEYAYDDSEASRRAALQRLKIKRSDKQSAGYIK